VARLADTRGLRPASVRPNHLGDGAPRGTCLCPGAKVLGSQTDLLTPWYDGRAEIWDRELGDRELTIPALCARLFLLPLFFVCSHHSASKDTLRNCTKCRGILACARLKPSLAGRQMRLLVGVTVRNSQSSAPFPLTVWPDRPYKGIKNRNKAEQNVVA
jgi:hypothetical protein